MSANAKETYVYRRGLSPNTLSVISAKNRIFAVSSQSPDNDSLRGLKTQVGVMSQFDPSENRSIESVRGIGMGDRIAELVPGATEAMTISVTRTAQYLENSMQAFGFKGGADGFVRSLRHHRWPFDIRQEIVMSQYLAVKAFGQDDKTDYSKENAGNDEYYGTAVTDPTGKPGYLVTATPVQGSNDAGITNGTGFGSNAKNGAITTVAEVDDAYAIQTVYEACWFQDYSTSYTSDSALVQENCSLQVSDVVAAEGVTFGFDNDEGVKYSSERMQGFYKS